MRAFIDRLKEPSSYAALAAVLAMVGVNVDPGLWQYFVAALTGLAGIAGFFAKEKGGGGA